jgi:hypothetical protein
VRPAENLDVALGAAVAVTARQGRDRAVEMGEFLLPSFNYYLDESDPDIAILRRQDGSFVAAFSASGATREGILEAAKEDYFELLLVHRTQLGEAAEIHRSA